MVFSGFLFYHVFLDRDGGAVRPGSRDLQTIKGAFRRCAIIRRIVTIPKNLVGRYCITELLWGETERVKVIEGCSRKVKKNIVMEAGQGTAGSGLLRNVAVNTDPIVPSDDICSPLL